MASTGYTPPGTVNSSSGDPASSSGPSLVSAERPLGYASPCKHARTAAAMTATVADDGPERPTSINSSVPSTSSSVLRQRAKLALARVKVAEAIAQAEAQQLAVLEAEEEAASSVHSGSSL
ncbi:unnamed protein product [Polarella glacialis]|uniref:Uncharacterized protein n=1 Tax=Polarella glacialis TaxID=89957 RepID=A0A813FB01_POLGL|nr:unnamed protein product [Polarella glacialis]CAE8723440.1 unnamed protein product [Polarella glacialis]